MLVCTVCVESQTCNSLTSSPSNSPNYNSLVFPEPKWGTEPAPSLDVARVRLRVTDEEKALDAKKSELASLSKDVSALDALVASNTATAAEKRERAEELQKEAVKTRAEESVRRADIAKAVEDADLECSEVDKLRESVRDLTATQEKNVTDLKLKLDNEEGNISTMEVEISGTLTELASIEKQTAKHKESEASKKVKTLAEIEGAKRLADIIKKAYERAQKDANDFSALPDEELATEMKHLDETEKAAITDANRERDEIIEMEPILEKLKLDFNSDVSLEEQKEAGMKFLRQHCQDFIETAKSERAARVENAKEAYLKEQKALQEEEIRRENEAQEARLAEEERLAEEARIRKEEEKVSVCYCIVICSVSICQHIPVTHITL